MKRKTKNILSIVLLIIITILLILTVIYAKNNITINENTMGSNMNGNMNNMEKPDGNSNSTNEPPAKPDDSNTTSDSNMNEGGTDEPPAKPDGDGTGDSNMNENSGNMEQPPAKPDEGNTTNDNTTTQMPGNNDNDMGNMNPNIDSTNNVSLSYLYIITIVLEVLFICLIVIYLIMSNFNKRNIKETFYSKDKVLIYVLLLVMFTAILSYGIIYLANNYILNENNDMSKSVESNANISYSAINEITSSKDIEDEEYESDNADENALLVNGDITVNASNIKVNKTGDSSGGDNTSFYGINSAILAKSGAILTLKNIEVETNATGANGVFCYGGSATTNNSSSDGTTINISNSKITTTKDNSGGIMTTGGGIMNASNLTITTSGTSSAAIRSDRGGGEVNVDGGKYTTNGQGSPSIYSTANITVKNADLVSNVSEGIVIEGKNSVTINNVNLTDSNTKLNGQSTTYKNIFLYQSMSGDASEGVSSFKAIDSNIITNNGDTFYITNTESEIELENNTITNNDTSGNFLRAKADSWGNSGSNGGVVTLSMTNQNIEGDIVIDSISSLDMSMTKSSYKGTINGDNTAKNISITLDKNSKIVLTGDSYVNSLEDTDTTYSNIDLNGYKLYVGGKEIER